MNKKFIYRVQSPLGNGPYRPNFMDYLFTNDFGLFEELESHTTGAERPLPMHDIGRWPRFNEVCGFVSVSQALKWFDNELLRRLAKYDFYLRQVEVEVISAVSNKQCLAIPVSIIQS